METLNRTGHDIAATGVDSRMVQALAAVAEAVQRLHYGAIQITVHDGRVVQMEVTEKQRFT